MRTTSLSVSVFVLSCGMFEVGCAGSGAASGVPLEFGGKSSAGGQVGTGGVDNPGGANAGGNDSGNGGSSVTSGGTSSVGGTTTSGGKSSTGGSVATGGKANTGGSTPTGGSVATGGKATTGGGATGGAATGGKAATGGAGTGGFGFPTGGAASGGAGTKATGGGATGGASTVSTSAEPDCNATMPTGGTIHTYGSGAQTGGTSPLAWEIWSNGGSPGSLTTFSVPAFSATWNNSQNYLGRLGYEWGSAGGAYTTHGTITAQFASKKTGSSGGKWSYIGMYGWTTGPCIEWYIIDDSFSTMPTNPGNCNNMSNSGMTIDGGKYTMCVRNTSGTGGDRCGGAGSWNQYYSIRQSSRTCGTISVSEHFKAWEAAGNSMAGKLLEVKILVEVGGGQGTVDFPIAKVTAEK